ncbi:MAG TPA: c-type cytochrome domain-containing protein [Kofleriaceae bacterium]
MRRMLLVGALAGLPGCPSDPPPECLTPVVDTTCAPGYVPTFTNVYNNTLRDSCGSTDSSCHSASGRAGNLTFQDQATAYDQLTSKGYVKPGDPTCSEFIVRTHSPGEDYQMPPSLTLTPEVRCALAQWVQMGALP